MPSARLHETRKADNALRHCPNRRLWSIVAGGFIAQRNGRKILRWRFGGVAQKRHRVASVDIQKLNPLAAVLNAPAGFQVALEA